MSDLNKLTLVESLLGIKQKKFNPKEIFSDCLKRIKDIDKKIFSFVTTNNLPMSGIPFAVKDVLSTKGLKTTASSKILDNYIPPFDATVVEKLKKAGSAVIGKTNCDAFAFGASTENSGFGPTKNPWDLTRVAGGSSGGSAAAVAADECIFALGTDTGGSIRQPASFCGISGLKPTYGVCSRYGLLAMASSLDCPGPMGKTVEDCEVIFNLMRGEDEKDATTKTGSHKDPPLLKLRRTTVGLPKEFFSDGIDNEVKDSVKEAAKLLEKNGIFFEEVSLPHTEFCVPVYYVIVSSEISSNMARYTGARFGHERKLFEEEVKRRIMLGTYSLSAGYFDEFYLKASKVRRLILDDYQKAFKKVDLLLGPVLPNVAFKIGEKTSDPLKMYLEDILTTGANLAGIPGLALPCGFSGENLPVGMQILGPHFSENLIFDLGKKYQSLTDWHKKRPNI